MVDASRFQEADKYEAYLRTPLGRLRSELSWENLRRRLPRDTKNRRALDIGGGTAAISARLAQMGFDVVLLDCSEEMLGIARRCAENGGVAQRISFCHADARNAHDIFDPGSFDVVVAHNFLEYVEDAVTMIGDIARLLGNDGVLSLVARNRAGEVLRAVIQSEDLPLATRNISAETVVDSLYGRPVRVFAPVELRDMMNQAGLEIIAEHGVRVFSDYLHIEDMNPDLYAQVLELELALGTRAEFAAIARYTQTFARRGGASSRKEAGE